MLPIIQKHSNKISQNQKMLPIIVPPGIVSRKRTGISRQSTNSKLYHPGVVVFFSISFLVFNALIQCWCISLVGGVLRCMLFFVVTLLVVLPSQEQTLSSEDEHHAAKRDPNH